MKIRHLEVWFLKLKEIILGLEAKTDLKAGLVWKAVGFQGSIQLFKENKLKFRNRVASKIKIIYLIWLILLQLK